MGPEDTPTPAASPARRRPAEGRPPRRSTLPSAPQGDLYSRVAVVERTQHHHQEDVEDIKSVVAKLDAKSDEMRESFDKMAAEVAKITAGRKFLTKVALGVLSSLALTLMGFLVKIAMIVQGGKLPTP